MTSRFEECNHDMRVKMYHEHEFRNRVAIWVVKWPNPLIFCSLAFIRPYFLIMMKTVPFKPFLTKSVQLFQHFLSI